MELFQKPKVLTVRGRDNNVIGIVKSANCADGVASGMIVLFSNPPPPLNETVYLIEYQVRDSKTGKKYVKCFKWLTEKQVEELNKRREEEEKRRALEETSKILNIPVDTLMRCLDLDIRMAVEVLGRETKRTVFGIGAGYWKCLLILLTHSKAIYIDVGTKVWAKIVDLPIDFDVHEAYSEKGVIVIDDAFEYFECREIAKALVKKGIPAVYYGGESGAKNSVTIVLPKDSELFKRLLAIKQTNMPIDIKKLVYLEVLGISKKEVAISD